MLEFCSALYALGNILAAYLDEAMRPKEIAGVHCEQEQRLGPLKLRIRHDSLQQAGPDASSSMLLVYRQGPQQGRIVARLESDDANNLLVNLGENEIGDTALGITRWQITLRQQGDYRPFVGGVRKSILDFTHLERPRLPGMGMGAHLRS